MGTPIAANPSSNTEVFMHLRQFQQWRGKQEGKMGYILLWALGVPIPLLFVVFLLRGCT
jgi:hypothetical protein